MEAAASWLLERLAEYLVDPTLQQLQFLFCVGKIARNVEIIKEELIVKQWRVQERIQKAINKTERIDDEVKKWKKYVERVIEDVEKLQEELSDNNGYLRGWCPTRSRYHLCKKLVETTKSMVDLIRKSDHFNTFSHFVTIPDIEYHSSKEFVFFKSTEKTYGEIWDALQDDNSSMIGLWGMGGSGKTTLVTEVGKNAKKSKLFDLVVKATISQSLNKMQVQGVIAEMLGLELGENSVEGRAKRIALRLQSGERILIILDDVWAKLNLEDIGIPLGGCQLRSCKVVLTTRRLDVCNLMGCERIVHLDLLTKDEAWTLFQTHANVNDTDVTQAIAMECKGLPIAILAVGTCLKGKGIDEINIILHELKNSKPINVDKGVRDAFACLKLSYDYLATKEAQLLLIMCAMFPEDHNIDVEDLFRYGVGFGLCGDVDSFEIARSQANIAINHLIDSSLLIRSSRFRECVTIHDVVRDFALWKASQENCTIMVNCSKESNKLIADKVVKDCHAISSWYYKNNLLQFPSQLDVSKLEFLLIRSKESFHISLASLEGIKRIKALIIVMSSDGVDFQPQPIQHLSNLQTLRLQYLDLSDISFVVSLSKLEILDLRHCKFEKVPNGIKKLSKLKLLDLSHCIIDKCFYNALGKCLQLEELYVPPHYTHSEKENCYGYLVNPTALMKLRRYNLVIGRHEYEDLKFHNEGTRSLHLGQLNISMFGAIVKKLAQRAVVIQFFELEGGHKSFMPNIIQAVGGMNELTKLCLRKCSEIECITDETTPHEVVVVSRLEELVLIDMDNIRQLCRGPSPLRLFQKMERLNISNCHKLLRIFPILCNLGSLKSLHISECVMLTSLFHVSVACTLLSLEELLIESCNELKHVVGGESGGGACQEQRMHDQDETQIVFPLLKYLYLKKLPKLVGICSEGYHPMWPSIKKIYWIDCPNMKLKGHQLRNEEYKPMKAIEVIKLQNCEVEPILYCQIGVEEQMPKFQYLKVLTLKNCARLKFVFSTHICQSLTELTSVTISSCDELGTIFLGNEAQNNQSLTKSCLPKLSYLRISGCNKLNFIFMISAATSMLPRLSTLIVSHSSQMEEIFKCSKIEDHDINNGREVTFPHMKRMELDNLPRLVNVYQGFKLHTKRIPTVKIHDCPKLVPIKSATMYWTEEGHKWHFIGDDKQEESNDSETIPLPQVSSNFQTSPNIEEELCANEEIGAMFISRIKSLWLEDSMNLISVWEGPKFITFQNLVGLSVVKFRKLKCIFPTTLMRSLPCLKHLWIEECEEMEEMMLPSSSEEEHNHFPNESSDSSLWFPQLVSLEVKRCRKLKWLFPSLPSTQLLPELTNLRIEECPRLEGLFNCKVEIHEEFFCYNNLLPNLKYLTVNEKHTTPAGLHSKGPNSQIAYLQVPKICRSRRKRLWPTCRDFVAKKRRKLASTLACEIVSASSYSSMKDVSASNN